MESEGKLLEAGKIVNTHGIRGEVKLQPWADSPAFLAGFDCLYIDGLPKKLTSARIHKNMLIAAFEGVSNIEDAIKLKNKTVFISRDDVTLDDGAHFIADLIGLKAVSETAEELGVVSDILPLPAGDVYVIKGEREIMIPAVPEFVLEINPGSGYIRFRLIDGM